MQAIISWLTAAVVAWSSPSTTPEHRSRVAEAFAAVAFDPDEPPIYPGPTGRAWTALTFVSIASLETRFRQRIIDGECLPHECDGGLASGLLQVHLGDFGTRLVGVKLQRCGGIAPDCLTKLDLNGDPVAQIRMGLHLYRVQGFKAWPTAPKARLQAAEWVRGHPVPGDTEEEASR